MKVYAVRVAAYIPYPIFREYAVNASSFSVAVSRAMRLYQKEDRVSRKRIDRMTVQAVRGTAKFL